MVRFNFSYEIDDKGQYEDNEIIVNLGKHNSLEDLINTIWHEYIHAELDSEDMTELKEHRIIKRLEWLDGDLI